MLISNIRKPLKTGVKSKNGQYMPASEKPSSYYEKVQHDVAERRWRALPIFADMRFLEVTLYNIKPVLLLTFMKQIATIRKKPLTNQS